MEEEETITYYDEIAEDYDNSRFGNSYGQFIHKQEEKILRPILRFYNPKKVLNLACGTGRFMELATFGVDGSKAMLDIAQAKFPKKEFQIADVADTNFPDGSFDLIFSLHLFMHLDFDKTQAIFREVDRLLRPGGVFIFDVPSKLRREWTKGHTNRSWHGSSAYTTEEIRQQMPENWDLHQTHGVLFFPIHRIPDKLRSYFFRADRFLCRNFAPYASYLMLVIEKDEL